MANPDPTEPSELNAEQSHATKGLLRLTMACNEKCPFCNVPAEDYSKLNPPLDTILDELQTFIDRGDKTLTVSGGEPTLNRKRLLTLVEKAKAGGIRFIELQTNAVLVKPEYAQALADAGVTSAFVSLLSHSPELHDHLAGLKGAYGRCLAGIDNLLDSGIRVALNPVTASTTQDHLGDYVEFVAKRFPRVRSISLSAVQPHGRGANNLDLMPDYARLRSSVQAAQKMAAHHGIELLNPYCGLPLCIGWENNLAYSVEAIEAQTPPNAHGVDNNGNKRHGDACRDCGLRARCGGAWHAYWDVRHGSGLIPPWEVQAPWAQSLELQEVVDARQKPLSQALFESGPPTRPTRWLWVDGLSARDASLTRSAGVTHVAIDIHLNDLKGSLKGLRRIQQTNRLVSPQRQIQIHGRIMTPIDTMPHHQVHELTALFKALNVTQMHAIQPGPHTEIFPKASG